jgi:hypothetical protein
MHFVGEFPAGDLQGDLLSGELMESLCIGIGRANANEKQRAATEHPPARR